MKTIKITGSLKEIYPHPSKKIRTRTEDGVDYYYRVKNKHILQHINIEDLFSIESTTHRYGHYGIEKITLIDSYNWSIDRVKNYSEKNDDDDVSPF